MSNYLRYTFFDFHWQNCRIALYSLYNVWFWFIFPLEMDREFDECGINNIENGTCTVANNRRWLRMSHLCSTSNQRWIVNKLQTKCSFFLLGCGTKLWIMVTKQQNGNKDGKIVCTKIALFFLLIIVCTDRQTRLFFLHQHTIIHNKLQINIDKNINIHITLHEQTIYTAMRYILCMWYFRQLFDTIQIYK